MDLEKMTKSALEQKKKGNTLQGQTKKQNEKRKIFIDVEELTVDEIYRSLIRHQTPEEEYQLKKSIEDEGIRDALVVYKRNENFVVVDGHHRLSAAKDMKIATVPIQEMQFANQDEARVWMLRNQLGRRNLGDAERIDIALKLTEFMEKLGIENKMTGKNLSANLHKGQKSQKIDRLQEASNIANVSRRNVAKYKKIFDSGDEKLLKEVVEGKKSIHKAHTEIAQKSKPKKELKVVKKAKVYSKEIETIFTKMEAWKKGNISDEDIKNLLQKHFGK
ncbi:ParB N-terminal domain-containing protein [Chondrinema litorale]|uniref:ParB N-terminal domain-containing protein n=1 Tax=Chondrinema litorale TaxID=2994555 RepID=UPI00254354AE|nr:ParB N-terminal domain-containing protein [Chondrinema litorale]UZS00088.1 ParB N-terminal domain-containing protein [Chondrinema litorale]